MTQEEVSGQAVAERVRAANISVGDSSSVEAMLANSLRERKPLADDGALHDTIQEAENAASSFVFVPPGTFNESVTIDTQGLTLLGSGHATLIDGGTNRTLSISASDVTIDSIRFKNDPSVNNRVLDSRTTGATNTTIKNCYGGDGGNATIDAGPHSKVYNTRVEKTAGSNVAIAVSEKSTIKSCYARNISGSDCFYAGGQDCIIANSIAVDAARYGVGAFSSDIIVIGNRIINASDNGIEVFDASDAIIANNRVSDSTNADIDDNGTNTTLDGNLTGTSN